MHFTQFNGNTMKTMEIEILLPFLQKSVMEALLKSCEQWLPLEVLFIATTQLQRFRFISKQTRWTVSIMYLLKFTLIILMSWGDVLLVGLNIMDISMLWHCPFFRTLCKLPVYSWDTPYKCLFFRSHCSFSLKATQLSIKPLIYAGNS